MPALKGFPVGAGVRSIAPNISNEGNQETMSLKIKSSSNTPAPTDTYIWLIDTLKEKSGTITRFGKKDTIIVTGPANACDPVTRQPYRLSKMFTKSIDPKSNFYDFVKTITGREPQLDHLGEFDADSLIGLSCEVDVKQNEKGGRVYANIAAYRPLAKGVRVPIPVLMPDRATAFPGAD